MTPNPSADGRFNISFDNPDNKDASFTVTDALGKFIKREYLSASANHMLDLSGAAKGLYYLTITAGDRSSTYKIIRD